LLFYVLFNLIIQSATTLKIARVALQTKRLDTHRTTGEIHHQMLSDTKPQQM